MKTRVSIPYSSGHRSHSGSAGTVPCVQHGQRVSIPYSSGHRSHLAQAVGVAPERLPYLKRSLDPLFIRSSFSPRNHLRAVFLGISLGLDPLFIRSSFSPIKIEVGMCARNTLVASRSLIHQVIVLTLHLSKPVQGCGRGAGLDPLFIRSSFSPGAPPSDWGAPPSLETSLDPLFIRSSFSRDVPQPT